MSITHETGARRKYATEFASTAEEQNELMWDKYEEGAAYNYKSTRPFQETNGHGYWFNKNVGGATYNVGLTSSLYTYSGDQGTGWFTTGNIDVGIYAGSSSRIVCFYTSGSSFRGDAQIGWARLGGTTWTFEIDADGWETTTANSSTLTYSTAVWANIANGTVVNRWNRDSGGTGSSGTGLSGTSAIYGNGSPGTWYLYAETSSPGYSNKDFLARSPVVTVSSNTLELVLAGYGLNVGTFDVYLDVVS